MADLPARRVHRGLRAVEGDPIVTFDSAHPDSLTVKLTSATGIFEFKLDPEQTDLLRYRLGRALDPANEPPRY